MKKRKSLIESVIRFTKALFHLIVHFLRGKSELVIMTKTTDKNTPDEFLLPDQVHIDRLREALWSGILYGRAAIMVGSGFSRNAQPTGTGTPTFPLWSELMTQIVTQSIADKNQDSEQFQRAIQFGKSTSGALRLAQEYEALHGRGQLDNLLKNAVPDQLYQPGNLHRLLLQLPWSDVFTTNWDTLLDRAADDLHERRYDQVLRIQDIPLTMRPRLVKLHGSFPSVGPFIFTEEDFRTYPQKFAPFVNLVQQSMMENLLCLIGFSGDDPNFLAWSGWVRDNLGENRPNMYLCGLLDLRQGERRMLEERRVTPIDLSPLFPAGSSIPREQRHGLSTEWLLLNLMNGQPPNPLDWPNDSKNAPTSIPGLPPVPQYTGPTPQFEDFGPNDG